jgi:thymidylate synthase
MNQYNNINFQYESLCRNILDNGEERNDRTGVGTISLFGSQLRIDLTHGFPLLTTKYIPWKHVVEELLWFMRGDTDSKIRKHNYRFYSP